MPCAVLFAVLSLTIVPPQAVPTSVPSSSAPSVEATGEAYDQFLLGRHLESAGDIDGAVAAYKRAMQLDPTAADIPAELAALYMRQNRVQEAIAEAEQALKIGPDNHEAHRVLGSVYAALADAVPRSQSNSQKAADYTTKAISNLEQALENAAGEPDPNLEATLARLYLGTEAYDKAIPLLRRLVTAQPGWREGPVMLAEAYAGAKRTSDAIDWLEQAAPEDPQLYPMLANFYERAHRWRDAARAYSKAVEKFPRNTDLQARYASALMNSGDRGSAVTARGVLETLLKAKPDDARVLYLLSQAQRRSGDLGAAESTARKVIQKNPQSPWGYYSLAETLEERQQFQAVIDALTPPVADLRTRGTAGSDDLTLLLPHIGFAYQQLGQYDKAIETFAEAHKLAPDDTAITGYLIQANLSAKRFDAALGLAKQARTASPDDLGLARLEAQVLQQSGKPDEGIALLEETV
jgi:tetratricopeptide (TPR) repeat protein